MAFIDNDSYLDYLQDINKSNKSIQNQFEINNYIKLSFESGKDEKPVFLESLLSQETLDISFRRFFKDFIEEHFNTERLDILKNKDLIFMSKIFSIVAKTHFDKYDFSFYGLTFEMFMPDSKKYSRQEKINIALSKLRDYKIILKRLKLAFYQEFELQQIKRHNVKEYMSNKLYEMKFEDKKKVNEYLSSKAIEIEGEDFSLLDLQNKTKQNKINEICMIKNHINKFQKEGWVCRFITVTNRSTHLPRAYNPEDKEHWDGITTPQDNAKELQRVWRTIQVRAKKHGIDMIGITAREPHKKGGVHQHFLILVKPENATKDSYLKAMKVYLDKGKFGLHDNIKQQVIDGKLTIEKMFLDAFGYTRRSCRIDVLHGQGKGNNVVNYITKYIMKTIDVKEFNGTKLDNEKTDSESNINKISFHRTTWRYRAYSFFGFKNSLTKWRLIRKFKHQVPNFLDVIKNDRLMKQLTYCVHSNNYSKFLDLAEGIQNFSFFKENKHGEDVSCYAGIMTNKSVYVIKHFEDEENYFNEIEMFSSVFDIEFTLFKEYEIKIKPNKTKKYKPKTFRPVNEIID
ncbi:replication endonuclease [Vibrio parahaemolyticus]|nr:replication endonuclease [Vibrio parahaemolyticus]